MKEKKHGIQRREAQACPRPLAELTLLDRFLFREAMDVPELYGLVVELLFGRQIEFLDKPQTEKELGISPQLRAVRLDVWNMDARGDVYSLEMQKENTHNLSRRSRFYQGQIDVSLMPPGSVDYNSLRDTYLVMICPFDPFGEGLCVYSFEMCCEEEAGLRLEDGAYRIFVNTKGKNRESYGEDFLNFLDYLNAAAESAESVITSEKVRKLHEGVKRLKQAETIGVRYMQEWEERTIEQQKAREEGISLGREEGISLGREEGISLGLSCGEIAKLVSQIRRKLQKGKKEEEIAEALEENVAFVQKVKEILSTAFELSDIEIARKYF